MLKTLLTFPTALYWAKVPYKGVKISFLLILFSLVSYGNSSSRVKLTVRFNNASLPNVLNSIEPKSGYLFLDKNELILPFTNEVNVDVELSGTVTGRDGVALPGVVVSAVGSTQVTVTDLNGKFKIKVPTTVTKITFSFIGMKTQEVTIGDNVVFNIKLEEDVKGLGEVVVVGYGVQKKSEVSGAISQVGREVFEDRAVPDIGNALQGVVPNLNINISSGQSTATPSYNVRGFESLNGGTPLILLDGVPWEDIRNINPENIESVTVLKDAASAAIYGARAAFGVILITTKNGKKNTPTTIKLNSSLILSDIIVNPTHLNSVEAAKAVNLARNNQNLPDQFTPDFVQHLQDYIDDPVNNPLYTKLSNGFYETYANVDVYREAYNDFAPAQNYNLSLSGGAEKSTYYASLGYLNDVGQWRINPDVNKRYTSLFKYKYDVSSWLTAGFDLGFNKSTYDESHIYPGNGNYFHALDRSKPWSPITTPDDFPLGGGLPFNHALNFQRYGGRDIDDQQQTYISANTSIKPFKGFVFNINFTHRSNAGQGLDHQKEIEFVTDDTPETPFYGQSTPSIVLRRSNTQTFNVLDLYGNYTFKLGEKNNFDLLAGYNETRSEFLNLSATGRNLVKNDFPVLSLVNGTTIVGDVNTFTALRGAFGRFNYNYDQKYFATINARYDGSDVFPKSNRYGFFPSISGAWLVSNEQFMDNIPLISNLKLRASYGSLGNQGVPSNLFRPLLGRNTAVSYLINGAQPQSINAGNIISSDLTWETSTTRNFGVDLGFFKNRLSTSLDVYKRVVSNMIVDSRPLPAILGTSAPQTNAADLETKGFELELGWRDQLKNGFSYGIAGTLSDNQAKITKYDLNPDGLLSDYYVGMTLGQIWGYETTGIFQTDADVAAAPSQTLIRNRQWKAGDIQYTDLNQDGKISSGVNTLTDPGDRKIIGNSNSRYNYGITTTAEYKGFDLNLFFRGVGKKDVYISNAAVFYWGHSGASNNLVSTGTHWALENSWTPDNPTAKLPIYATNSPYNSFTQTRFLERGAFIRLKSMNLGYNLSEPLLQTLKLNKVRVYLSGQNLWTFDHLYGIFDPELLGSINSTDGKIYPNSRSFAFGLQVIL